MAVVIFIIVLSVIVLFHELGHFLTAKKFGVKVEEFGIGYPPKIFGIKKNDTTYSINWIPVGGFVKLKGENGSEDEENDSFASKSILRRITILSAGVIMNVVLAMIALGIGFGIGLPTVIDENVPYDSIRDKKIQIISVSDDSPAKSADLKLGDVILKIDDQTMETSEDVQEYNKDRIGQTINLTISRYSEEKVIPITLEDVDDSGAGKMGIGLVETALVSYPWYESIWLGMKSAIDMLVLIIVAFYTMIRDLIIGQPIAAEVSGPVGIAVLSGQMAKLGMAYLLNFVAILSLNLAIINFLPIPALDGGRVVFLVIEKIRRKKINQRVEAMIHNVSFMIIMVLLVVVTFKDVSKFSDSIVKFFKSVMG
ncbi:RIP metalloprotease RseP [Patescibacteria group bacterium]|nr:RIP metalloprotease RseP [Patescibacteria group bacterium]MBU1890909.1 RIP metalloprotease RseP [Patescibacteria group bacterium]